jgi:hypothetical protein
VGNHAGGYGPVLRWDQVTSGVGITTSQKGSDWFRHLVCEIVKMIAATNDRQRRTPIRLVWSEETVTPLREFAASHGVCDALDGLTRTGPIQPGARTTPIAGQSRIRQQVQRVTKDERIAADAEPSSVEFGTDHPR